MMKMKIKLDEQKIKESGEYTVDEMYKKIDNLAKKVNITRKDKEGAFVGNNDRYDLASFIRIVLTLKDCNWFKPFVKEWLWDENGEVEDVVEFYNLKGQTV